MTERVPEAEQVLQVWFAQTPARLWFAAEAAIDAQLRERFGPLTQAAIAGELSAWGATAS